MPAHDECHRIEFEKHEDNKKRANVSSRRPLSQSLFGERLAGKETRLLSALSHVKMKASLAAIACVLLLCLQALLVQEIDAQGHRGGFVEGARGDRGLRVVREANRPPIPPGRRAAGVDFSDLSPGEVEKPDPDLLPGVRPRSDRRPRDVRNEKFESRQNGGTRGRRSGDGLPDLLPGEAEIPDPDLLPGVRPRSDRLPRDVLDEKFESRQNGGNWGRRSGDGLPDLLPGEAEIPDPDLLPGVRPRSDRLPRDVLDEKFESRQNGGNWGRRSGDGLPDLLPGEAEVLMPGVRPRGENEKHPPGLPGYH